MQKGIIIKKADNSSELKSIYQLRWRIYKDEGYIDQKDYSQNTLEDKYDEKSINFLAIHKNKTIGIVRLVLFSSLGFPTENAFNLKNIPHNEKNVAELSKLCVSKEYRNKTVAMGLLKEAYRYSRGNHIHYWIIGMPASLQERFSRLGFSFKEMPMAEIGPKQLLERRSASEYFKKAEIKPYLLKI